jgi:glycyl-tRNA synthetase beta chain
VLYGAGVVLQAAQHGATRPSIQSVEFFDMVTISFPDRDTEKRALAYLLGRFSGRALRSGEHIVPEAALEALADLRGVVDDFFDKVMVMADAVSVRDNRLRLLNELRALFNHTADFAEIQVD